MAGVILMLVKIAVLVWIWRQFAQPARNAGKSAVVSTIFGAVCFWAIVVAFAMAPYFLYTLYSTSANGQAEPPDDRLMERMQSISTVIGFACAVLAVRFLRTRLIAKRLVQKEVEPTSAGDVANRAVPDK